MVEIYLSNVKETQLVVYEEMVNEFCCYLYNVFNNFIYLLLKPYVQIATTSPTFLEQNNHCLREVLGKKCYLYQYHELSKKSFFITIHWKIEIIAWLMQKVWVS